MSMNTGWMKKIDWLSVEIIAYIEKCEKAIEAGLNEFAVVGCRTCAEQVLRTLYRLNGWKKDANYTFCTLTEGFQFKTWLNDSYVWQGIERIRSYGNNKAHNITVEAGTSIANECLMNLVAFVHVACKRMGRPEVGRFEFSRVELKTQANDTKKAEFEKLQKQLEENMQTLQARIETAEKARKQAEEKQRIAEAAKKKAEESEKEAYRKLKKAQDDAAREKAQHGFIKGELSKAVELAKKLASEKEAAEAEVEKARKAVRSAIKESDTSAKEVAAMRQKLQNAEARLANIEKQTGASDAEVARLTKAAKDADAKLKASEKAAADAQKKAKEATDEALRLASALRNANDSIRRLMDEKEETERRFNEMLNKFDSLVAELNAMKKALDDANRKNAENSAILSFFGTMTKKNIA